MSSWKWLFFTAAWCLHAQTANDLFQQGRYNDAIAMLSKELGMMETRGAKHRDVASALNTLALAESKMGRYRDAEEHFLRAIFNWESDGEAQVQLAIGMSNLAGLRARQGRYQESIELQRRALSLLQTGGGS